MKLEARSAKRPDLVSTRSASMRPSSALATPTATAWNRISAPAASSIASAAHLNAGVS